MALSKTSPAGYEIEDSPKPLASRFKIFSTAGHHSGKCRSLGLKRSKLITEVVLQYERRLGIFPNIILRPLLHPFQIRMIFKSAVEHNKASLADTSALDIEAED